MGAYHIFVNPSRKEYFDPAVWGDGSKRASLFNGLHRFALRLLMYSPHAAPGQLSPTLTSWVGDPIIIAADDYYTDQDCFKTQTPEDGERNLYYMARDEFRNITPELTLLLVPSEEEFTKALMERALQFSHVLLFVGSLCYETRNKPLSHALEKHLGPDWAKMYSLAVKMSN